MPQLKQSASPSQVNEEMLEGGDERGELHTFAVNGASEELSEITSHVNEKQSETKFTVNEVLSPFKSQEGGEPSEITSIVNEISPPIMLQESGEPSEIMSTVNKIHVLPTITSQEIEEPSQITSHVEPNKLTLNEVLLEITSFPANEEPSKVTSQLVNGEPRETRSSDEEESFYSSDSGDAFEGLSEVGSDEGAHRETADFESEEDASETADFGSCQDLSEVTSDQSLKDSPVVASLKQSDVDELRLWVETEAKFYGRTDDAFLVMFLLGCKTDMKKTKNKMIKYYQSRKKIPLWLDNRNINDLEDLLQKRMCVLLTDTDPQLPAIALIRYGKFGSDPKQSDKLMTLTTILIDITLRRNNCQQNGAHCVIDWLDYPLWLATKLLNPVFLYNLTQCVLSVPVRIKGVHFINFPVIGRSIWQLGKPFYPKKIRDRFTFSGADLTALFEKVDVRLWPTEYGGTNGSLVDHEEAFIQEMHSYSDYFLDDNKYGFDKN